MLEEAACELFLERGYAETSVADITRRAGVSRATFFNYVDSKSDLLWASVDDAISKVRRALEAQGEGGTELGQIRALLGEVAGELKPGVAVLALANAEAMGVTSELLATGAQRQAALAGVLSAGLRAAGRDALESDVLARAHAGAFFAALEAWAAETPGSRPFNEPVQDALRALGSSAEPQA